MQAPEWFLSYMNKFEDKLDKRFDQVDKRLDQIENRLDNVENDIKSMKMTPTMHKELEKHNS